MTIETQDRIVRDIKICHGAPVIKGTRIRIKVILDNLAEGHTPEDIVGSYPGLTVADVYTVIAFAARSVADELLLSVPTELSAG